ncbi:hypothetical protein [Chromatocurvus halotolerans]|nr:hypothetical protein [Chromatocurvus halotolerans]
MSLTYLLVSMVTPWLAGLSVQRALESRAAYPPHPLRQAAFGFFLGYSLLQWLVLTVSGIFGHVSITGLNLALMLIALLSHLIYRRFKHHPGPPQWISPVPLQTDWVFWFFLILALVHLLLSTLETLHRPVFPWDAWLSWMYRAKAWFYAGSILPMDSPADWLSGAGDALYNVAGAHYPTLVPITAFWTALHLGEWSETLVNLPVLGCGLALGAGLYGLSREAGATRAKSAIGAYFLLSIPLVGAHLSLAGQADIWMAGYAGLGTSACLLGLARRDRHFFWLGLLLVALSTGVKAEGGIWLAVVGCVGLVVWLDSRRKLATALILPGMLLALWVAGIRYVDLPLFGGVGVRDGVLHASFLGAHPLESHSILDDYWQNFMAGGSWHLLWPLVFLAALASLGQANTDLRRVIPAFVIVLIASQAFIFGATSQGRWAEDWTAINRIPLHMAPALVFCLVLMVTRRNPSQSVSGAQLLITGSLATIALSIATLVFLGAGAMGDSAKAIEIAPADHKLVMGQGTLNDNTRAITRFDNNVALVSSGPVRINTAGLSLISVVTGGENKNGQNVFWRTREDPENLKMLQYEGRGTHYLQLAENDDWSGTVTEIGLVFYDDGGTLTVGDIRVQADSFGTRLQRVLTEWTQMMPWSQKSVHWLPAGAPESLLPLPAFIAGWLLLAIVILRIRRARHPGSRFASAATLSVAAWLLLDARWLMNHTINTADTVSDYPLASNQPLRFGGDRTLTSVLEDVNGTLADDQRPLLITSDDLRMRYQMLRAKYHALPRAAFVEERTREEIRTQWQHRAHHLLVLKQPYRDPAARPTTAMEWQAFFSEEDNQYTVVRETADAFLLSRTSGDRRNADEQVEK